MKGRALTLGEENLGSDLDFVVEHLKVYRGVPKAQADSAEVQEIMDRTTRHANNFASAMKSYK